jgi:hypothetical protein
MPDDGRRWLVNDFNLEFIFKVADLAGLAVTSTDDAHVLMGTSAQWERFGTRLHDERWVKMLHRRVAAEQLMLDAANNKRPPPTLQELREWALKLGTAS